MGLSGRDEVAGAVEIGPPDGVLVLGAKQRREVDDRVDALEGLGEGLGSFEVAAHGG